MIYISILLHISNFCNDFHDIKNTNELILDLRKSIYSKYRRKIMNRLFACILAAIILAATFAGCAVTATRTTPYPTARPDTDFDLTQPGPPGYGMDENVPYDGYVTPRGNIDTTPVR